MHAHDKSRDGLTVFLHLYTSQICIRKRFIFYPKEKRKIKIEKERLGTVFPATFVLEREGERWLLDGRAIPKESSTWIHTQAEEEILLVLSDGKEFLQSCGRIPLDRKSVV